MESIGVDEDRSWAGNLPAFGLEPGTPLLAKILIEAPGDRVWAKIAEPGYLKHCHPFCKSTEVEIWPGAGSRDSITYYSGRRYQRNFVAWLDGVGYDIELGDPPNQTCRVLWRISPLSQAQCEFSIEVVPYLKSDLPVEKKQQYQAHLFGLDLQHYLDCVVKGVDYWVVTGRDVVKDQFGANPLYSG